MEQNLEQKVQESHALIDKFSKEVKDFYHFHGLQMIGSDFPISLVEELHDKLTKATYDGGEYFELLDNQDEEVFEVKATKDLAKNNHVFLIDHALTFRFPELRSTLNQNPQMIVRLKNMLKYNDQLKTLPVGEEVVVNEQEAQVRELQFDGMELADLGGLEFPPNLVTLSLMNNKLSDEEELTKKLNYLNLKVLWLNGNPIIESPTFQEYIISKTKVQIYNSKFTTNCKDWGLKYAHNRNISFANSANHHEIKTLKLNGRNIFNVDISIFQKFTKLTSLSIKDHKLQTQQHKQYLLKLLKLKSLKYLIVDEAIEKYLFEAYQDKKIIDEDAKRVLVNKHSLLMSELNPHDTQLDFIGKNILKIAGCYRLANTQQIDESSCWYVNDELGSLISHSDTPNIKIIPFLFAADNQMNQNVVAFSLLWSLQDIKQGDLITKDFLHGLSEQKQRSSRLAIWYKLPEQLYLGLNKSFDDKMFDLSKESLSVLEKFYAINATKQKELSLKFLEEEFFEGTHKVITDYEYINKYLKHERFQITSELEEATIVWLTGAAEEEEWKKYKGKYFLNQFPFESCIVMKHNLADTVQSVLGDTKFLQRTYNLEKELPLMIGEFYKREKQGLDNLWILKPPNMARSMDMIITDNLSVIIKSMETGPRIAQKYISQPVLRNGRKVDLRYILLVKSISPLTLYLYKNFWIRSSNNPYTVDRRYLSTYQTQFTVMNYGKVSDFQQIAYKDFIVDFEKDYPQTKWTTINDKIKKILRNVFIAVGVKYPQMHDNKSRAVYGIDIMVEEDTMEPKLLEITFSPDCKRACEYYPTFYNQIFQTLYLETPTQNMERII